MKNHCLSIIIKLTISYFSVSGKFQQNWFYYDTYIVSTFIGKWIWEEIIINNEIYIFLFYLIKIQFDLISFSIFIFLLFIFIYYTTLFFILIHYSFILKNCLLNNIIFIILLLIFLINNYLYFYFVFTHKIFLRTYEICNDFINVMLKMYW